jgi:hypothetical protein
MESAWTWVLASLALAVFMFVFFWQTEPFGKDPRGKS